MTREATTWSLTGHSRRRPVAFVQFSTQFENAGDCLINRELVRLLAVRADLCLDVSLCPPAFAEQVLQGLPQRERLRGGREPFLLRMLRARRSGRRCFLFLMPGAVTGARPATGVVPDRIRDLSMPIAWALGVRICKVGASFGGLSEDHLATWRRRRRWMFRICPRDTTSADYLRAHGVIPDPCIPDLAFNVFDGSPAAVRGPTPERRAAGLSFRTDQDPRQATDVTAGVLELARRSGVEVRWRPVVQVARDRPGMEALGARLRADGYAVEPVLDLHADVEACLAFYREVPVVVSNRLHAILMAASQGARVLPVADGPPGAKLSGVLRDLGLGQAATTGAGLAQCGALDDVAVQVDGTSMRERLHRAFDELLPSESVAGSERT